MYTVPSGISAVFNPDKKYDNFRPQIPLSQLREGPASGQKCTLCYQPNDQRDLKVFYDIGWRLRGNRDPNQPFSRLIVPFTCADWSPERLRLLGGTEQISNAFSAINFGLGEAREKGSQVLCHVGYSAGQNWYHPHYHIVQPHVNDSKALTNTLSWVWSEHPERPSFVSGPWGVMLGGLMSGTLWLHPKKLVLFSEAKDHLAEELNSLIIHVCQKCANHSGEPPDYHFAIQIGPQGHLLFVYFRVILNQLGANDGAGLNMGTQCTTYYPNTEIAKLLFG